MSHNLLYKKNLILLEWCVMFYNSWLVCTRANWWRSQHWQKVQHKKQRASQKQKTGNGGGCVQEDDFIFLINLDLGSALPCTPSDDQLFRR